jgi:signal transduction histidine kinase
MSHDHAEGRRDLRQLARRLPQLEKFIESRESYIKTLEGTIESLRGEVARQATTTLAISSSLDELVATQRMANTISTATSPDLIQSALVDLTRQVVDVIDANIFLFGESSAAMAPLTGGAPERLTLEASAQQEAGIVDWVIAEKKPVVVPDLDHMMGDGSARNFIIVPLILRSRGIGFYLIHTGQRQEEFSGQQLQLLAVLANQAAVGIEHWRTYDELVRMHGELQASQAQMIQAAKLAALGELAAGIVHEIKNPLQVLKLHLEMLKRGRPMPGWEEMFTRQVVRLTEMTQRLMNFSHNVADDLVMAPLQLNDVVGDILGMVRKEFEGHGIRFEVSLAPELPPVRGNANYLQQVLLNLLINARDAMSEGGTLSITTSPAGSAVRVSVTDSGPGIPESLKEKIFQPFFTTKGTQGTGLGLAICAKIVAQHEGFLRLESAPGKGATFTVVIPIAKESPCA